MDRWLEDEWTDGLRTCQKHATREYIEGSTKLLSHTVVLFVTCLRYSTVLLSVFCYHTCQLHAFGGCGKREARKKLVHGEA